MVLTPSLSCCFMFCQENILLSNCRFGVWLKQQWIMLKSISLQIASKWFQTIFEINLFIVSLLSFITYFYIMELWKVLLMFLSHFHLIYHLYLFAIAGMVRLCCPLQRYEQYHCLKCISYQTLPLLLSITLISGIQGDYIILCKFLSGYKNSALITWHMVTTGAVTRLWPMMGPWETDQTK